MIVIDIDASVEGSTEQEKASSGVPLTLQAASQPLHYGQSTVAPDNLPITPRRTEKERQLCPRAPPMTIEREVPCTSLINEGGYPSSRPFQRPLSTWEAHSPWTSRGVTAGDKNYRHLFPSLWS